MKSNSSLDAIAAKKRPDDLAKIAIAVVVKNNTKIADLNDIRICQLRHACTIVRLFDVQSDSAYIFAGSVVDTTRLLQTLPDAI